MRDSVAFCWFFIFFFLSEEVTSDCTVDENESLHAFNQLFYMGSQKVLKANNEKEVDKRCAQIAENAEILKKQMDCAPEGSLKHVFSTYANNYLTGGKKKCESGEYRKGYVQFSQCISKGDTLERFHQCGYKLGKAWTFALENYPVEEQMPNACCALLFLDNCVAQELSHCPADSFRFFQELYYSHAAEALEYSCKPNLSIEYCKARLPKVMEKSKEIFESTEIIPTPELSMYDPFYQMLVNLGEKRPNVN